MPEMDVSADSDATATLKFFLSRHIWTYPGLVAGAILFASSVAALAVATIPGPDSLVHTW